MSLKSIICIRICYTFYYITCILDHCSTIEPIPPGVDKHIITILDIQNKFIVFSATMVSVQTVLSEWGGFFVLSGDNKLYHLDEKDLQSKLALLFKKNLYDVSIRYVGYLSNPI
jgi:hypothetical protein